MNKMDFISPRPYKGHRYRITVDGETVAEFGTLVELDFKQTESTKNDYSKILLIPAHLLTVEAA